MGEEVDRERERGRGERKRRKEKEKRKERFGFENPNLFPTKILNFQLQFSVILIVFSIFEKYDINMNF